jgi:hypothetical protein
MAAAVDVYEVSGYTGVSVQVLLEGLWSPSPGLPIERGDRKQQASEDIRAAPAP